LSSQENPSVADMTSELRFIINKLHFSRRQKTQPKLSNERNQYMLYTIEVKKVNTRLSALSKYIKMKKFLDDF